VRKTQLWRLAANDDDYPTCTFRFAGQYVDEESGLYYNRYRYYLPETGQYISSDPIGLAGGNNPYGYVNDPLGYVDPLGLAGCPQVDAVLSETKNGRGNITSKETLTADQLLDAGMEHIGNNYTEIGKPGSLVFRSNVPNTDNNHSTGGYLILILDDVTGKNGFDYWVDNNEALKNFFVESSWNIKWLS